jgi:hypothetical protein
MFSVRSSKERLFWGNGRAVCKAIMVGLMGSALMVALSAPRANAATYYVSPKGNNTTGMSWATAWSELDQIQWSQLQGSDTVEIDGGTGSTVYSTTLTFPSNAPLVYVVRSGETGHTGTIILDGTHNTSGIAVNMLGQGYFGGGSFLNSQTQSVIIQNFPNVAVYIKNASGTQELGGVTFRRNKTGVHVYGIGTAVSGNGSAQVASIGSCIFKDCSHAGIVVGPETAANVNQNWFFNSDNPSPSSYEAGVIGNAGILGNCIFGPNLNYGLFSSSQKAPPTYPGGSLSNGVGWQCLQCLFIDAQKANISLTNTSGVALSSPQVFQNLTLYCTPLNANGHARANFASNIGPGNIAVSNSVVYGGSIVVPTADGVIAAPSGLVNFQYNVNGNTLTLASTQQDPQFGDKALYSLPNNVSGAKLINASYSVPYYYLPGGGYNVPGSFETSVLQLLREMGYVGP